MGVVVRTKRVSALRYRARERVVTLGELDAFLEEAVQQLRAEGAHGAPFAIYHGHVNDRSRSLVEVGMAADDGDRTLPGGTVVYGLAGKEQTAYAPIHEIYDAIARYIEDHGLRHNAPTRELYVGRDHFTDEIEVIWPVDDMASQ